MGQSPYDLSDNEKIKNLVIAARRSGFSGSGQVLSCSAGADASDQSFWWGVLEARLDGVQPPVRPGDRLRPTKSPISASWRDTGEHLVPVVQVVGEFTVHGVRYHNKTWHISFKEEVPALWAPDDDGDRVYPFGERRFFRYTDFESVPVSTEGAA